MASKPPVSETPVLRSLLGRLEAWLAKHRKRFLSGLQPPASDADLRALEAAIKRPLPEALRTLLAWHNGQGEDYVGFFEDRWVLMRSAMIADVKPGLDADAKENGWQPAWIPFLDDDQGDYLCLDTSQSPPLVRWFLLGEKQHAVVAPSLSAWLTMFVDNVEKGRYTEDPERGEMILKDSGK
jgi:cell wall assembly regulator SMI1